MNFIEMQNDIADELVSESLTGEQVKKAIIRTIKRYEREEFWFARKQINFNTVPGQDYYGTAANAMIPGILKVFSMTVAEEPLRPCSIAQLAEAPDTIGRPRNYTTDGTQLRLYPTPIDAETVQVFAWVKLPELEKESDTNAWLTEGEELIRQGAKRRLCTDILNDEKMGVKFGALESEAYLSLKAETRRKLPEQPRQTELAGFVGHEFFDVRTG